MLTCGDRWLVVRGVDSALMRAKGEGSEMLVSFVFGFGAESLRNPESFTGLYPEYRCRVHF